MTKLKNTDRDKTKKFKLWPNPETQCVTKLNLNCDQTQKLKLGQKSEVTVLTVVTVVTIVTVVPVITVVTEVTVGTKKLSQFFFFNFKI